MSNITQKAAYLKGLFDGLEIDQSTKEGKLMSAMVAIVEEMAETIAELEDVFDELDEAVDEIDEDLSDLEEDYYGADDYDDDDDYFDDDDDENFLDEDTELFDVTCPSCKDTIYLDSSMLSEGSMDCPNCSELLEFDLQEDEIG